MTDAFLAGALAGYAIAIPVGAIAVLIVELGMRHGLRVGAAAGAGAATADGLYALLAVTAGTAVAAVLAPVEGAMRIVAAGVLLGLALRGIASMILGRRDAGARSTPAIGPMATYARFVGLTILNPATVVYFAALILGLSGLAAGPLERAAFVAGAFLSSLSWQLLLAAVGAIAHRRLPPGVQLAVSLLGNLIIAAFALRIAGFI